MSDNPKSIAQWALHRLLTRRNSGSLTDDSIKALFIAKVERDEVVADDLFDAILAIANEAFVAGMNARGDNYANALWHLHRMNVSFLDSMKIDKFIKRHMKEAGVVEFHGLNGMSTENYEVGG